MRSRATSAEILLHFVATQKATPHWGKKWGKETGFSPAALTMHLEKTGTSTEFSGGGKYSGTYGIANARGAQRCRKGRVVRLSALTLRREKAVNTA